MLINCKHCDTEFDVNVEKVALDGGLVKCENCQEEWVQQSESQYLEKKLIALDQNLQTTEIHLTEQKSVHNDKISKLENSLKAKKEELAKQKLLEERIVMFEKRITDTENEIAAQAVEENKITQLEKELKKNSSETLVVSTNLEKKVNYLQMKINSEGIGDRLNNLENNISSGEKLSSIKAKKNSTHYPNFKENQTKKEREIKKSEVIDTKKSNKFFFWKNKKDNADSNKKNFHSSQYANTQPDIWDLSEKTIEHELRELRKKKKSS